MKRMKLILVLMSAFLSMYGQKVDLIGEDVTFKLDAKHVETTAVLSLRSNSGFDLSQVMFVPMPLRKEGLLRDTLIIFDITRNNPITHTRSQPAGLFFSVPFGPNEQKKLRISYIDDHNGKYFMYPMKMQAGYWQGMLSSAGYTLRYDENVVVIDSTSMTPDGTEKTDTGTILSWKRSKFTPLSEFEVWFHLKK
ncbi:MAG TPA: hypothetical protein PKJ28_06720 [Bacteroidales bacterium]|nr:hypothetical protein [Bacteroidales bacterium]